MNNNLNDCDSQQDFEVNRNPSVHAPVEYDIDKGLEESSFKEIELYNQEISFEENFKTIKTPKYILVEVKPFGDMTVMDGEFYESILTSSDKFVVRRDQYEEYQFDSHMVDYDTIFGTRFLTFRKYNSDFFSCDERVVFEALLIKYKKSGFKTFYWSKTRIFSEIGVKKDRADKIIKKFTALGFLSVETKTRQHEGKPQQVTYFSLHPEKVIELLPQIFLESAEFNFNVQRDIIRYLKPGYKKPAKK